MVRRRGATSKPGATDWFDVLFASTVASWATFMAAMSFVAISALILNFSIEGLIAVSSMLVMAASISFFIALFACVILGLPALGIVGLLNLNDWWHSAVLGLLAAFIVFVVLTGGTFARNEVFAGVLLLAGAIAGVAAWRVRKNLAVSH